MSKLVIRASDVAVVVTTYNRSAALSWVLASLASQTRVPGHIVIADDGSGPQTKVLIEQWKAYFLTHHPNTQVTHAWQEDLGFRAAAVRNLAVAQLRQIANPKALIFMDGDCVAPTFFVQNHLALLTSDHMVAGGRGLLSQRYTRQLEQLAERQSPSELLQGLSAFQSPYRLWLGKACDRYLSMLPWLNAVFNPLRDARPTDDQLVRTCNLSLWLDDFEKVGGFDESFMGWGLEDTDLAVRMISGGTRVRSGRFATNVFHLWHPERSRAELKENAERLAASRQQSVEVARS